MTTERIRTLALLAILAFLAFFTGVLLGINGNLHTSEKLKSNCVDLTYRQFRQGSRVVAVIEDPACEYGG